MHSLYEKLDVKDSWESVINIISRDNRIGESHMNVPGHDGKKGFGGACFPKDSLALVKFADSLGVDLKSLISTIKINKKQDLNIKILIHVNQAKCVIR